MANRQDVQLVCLEAWEVLAERYAALVDSKAENAYCERPATLFLLPDVRGKKVLDAGCGAGSYSEWLVAHGAEVVALDVSPKMVRLAQKRLGTRVCVRPADLNRPLDFLEDESLDIVLCPLVLDYIEDWRSTFAEFCRVLCEHGLFIFSIGHPLTEFTLRSGGDYFATELAETEWTSFGVRVLMPSYRRPLGSVIAALAGAGFVVEQMIEPRPTQECRSRDAATYRRLSRLPGFLCIRARKRNREEERNRL